MVKVKTQGEHRFGKEYVYSIGKVVFNNEGVAEIEEKLVQKLLEIDSRLFVVEDKKDSLTEEQKQIIEAENKRKEKEKELQSLNKKDLVELALVVPGADKVKVESLKKEELVNFLIDKID